MQQTEEEEKGDKEEKKKKKKKKKKITAAAAGPKLVRKGERGLKFFLDHSGGFSSRLRSTQNHASFSVSALYLA